MARPRIRTYEEAALFLRQSNSRRTSQKGTMIVRLTPTEIAVRYHHTDVVIYHHPQITDRVATIDAGGWTTLTTVNRINEYAPDGITAYHDEDYLIVLDDPAHGVHGRRLTLADPYVVPRDHSLRVGVESHEVAEERPHLTGKVTD